MYDPKLRIHFESLFFYFLSTLFKKSVPLSKQGNINELRQILNLMILLNIQFQKMNMEHLLGKHYINVLLRSILKPFKICVDFTLDPCGSRNCKTAGGQC